MTAMAANSPASAHDEVFADVCADLSSQLDLCEEASTTALLLAPTYMTDKQGAAVNSLENLDYAATYIPAKTGWFSDTTDLFFAGVPGSNRVYVVVTGTESARDWYENAKKTPYTTVWTDGIYYIPPGHAGFRSGTINVINAALRQNEFDAGGLDCSNANGASRLTRFVCERGIGDGSGQPIDLVLVGHSRGSAIVNLTALAFDGFEIAAEGDGMTVKRQEHWPYRVAGVFGFAPPPAIYLRTDAEAGMWVPTGAPDQWAVYDRTSLDENTFLFINRNDLVPNLSLGDGVQLGHRFEYGSDGKLEYAGFHSRASIDFGAAHSSVGYCETILKASPGSVVGSC